MSDSLGTDLFYAKQILEQFGNLSEKGYADEDHSALYRLFK
jgi:3-hydroxyisobutyrate dehydrogenase-like beta-hydroxyacid dehydrogenase